jgi:hypothetical protein
MTEEMENQEKLAESLAKTEERELATLEKRLFALKELNEQMEALRSEAGGLGGADATPQEIQAMRDRIAQTEDPEERVKLIQDMNRLLQIREEIQAIQQKIDQESAAASDLALRNAEKEAAGKEAALKAEQDAARIRADQDRAQADFAAEIQALQLELAGRKDLADSLREETRLRSESIRLAEQMGISEEQALALLRQQADLRRKINGDESARETARRAPATRNRGLTTGTLSTGNLSRGAISLREAALNRIGETRALKQAAEKPQENPAEFWRQQLDLQARLVKKFDQLTAV